MENFLVNVALPGTIVLALIAAGLFVFSLLAGIFQNVRGSLKLLVGVAVILITYFICYATATEVNPTNLPMSAGSIKFVTAGIYTMITMVILAVITWISMAIYNTIN